ncbi:MAG: AAA family ATPase, partial [Vicinamibacterales bacterium]
MRQIKLRILGESVIQVGEITVVPTATHLFALLLYLGLECGRVITRTELGALLFADDNSSSAAHNLRQLLYRVRRMGVPIASKSSSVSLAVDLVQDGIKDALSGSYSERSKARPSSYLLLPHYTPPTDAFSHWLERFRDRLQHQLLRGLAEDIQSARRVADWRAVEGLATASLELDPYNETATLFLAEALARTGSKHKAVALLSEFEEEVGRSTGSLTLPSRLLKRRIFESPIGGIGPLDIPLIGRANEMRVLTTQWNSARNGLCSAVALSGEKSIGKSRLVSELLSLIRLDGSGVVLTTRRLPPDRHRPMSLFADICKQLICIPGG